MLEERLKKTTKESDKEKNLRQVLESNIYDKNCELHGSEKRLAPTEKERTSTEMKVMCLEKKLEESDTSLAQALSVASAKT